MNQSFSSNWTREELMLAIYLYCRIPFGKIHTHNPEIIELSNLIKRSPSALSWKLVNFAHLDDSIKQQGASHTSKLDRIVWNEYIADWNNSTLESEQILNSFKNRSQTDKITELDGSLKLGFDVERITKTRVNQDFFRAAVFGSYTSKCCITGMSNPALLIASHIIPWSENVETRTNPRNGLCLNALHDRAFDKGLLTLDDDFRIVLSSKMNRIEQWVKLYFTIYEGNAIIMPNRFLPDQRFLDYHRTKVFQV